MPGVCACACAYLTSVNQARQHVLKVFMRMIEREVLSVHQGEYELYYTLVKC